MNVESHFTCAHCDLQFDNVQEFDTHEKTHTVVVDGDDVNIVVDDDLQQYQASQEDEYHEQLEEVDESGQNTLAADVYIENHCPQCQLTFGDRESLHLHMRDTHHTQAVTGKQPDNVPEPRKDPPRSYQCQICLLGFPKPHLLRTHVTQHHSSSAAHMRGQHLQQQRHQHVTYQCSECSQSFNDRRAHDEHVCADVLDRRNEETINEREEQEPPTRRLPQGMKLDEPDRMDNEDLNVNVDGITFQCDKCREVFDTRDEADTHAAICSSAELFPVQQQPQNGRTYRTKNYNSAAGGSQQQHVYVDDPYNYSREDDDDVTKIYYCEQCDLHIKTPAALRAHMEQVHADPNDKPRYSCGECDKTYATIGNLNIHIRRVHPHREQNDVEVCGSCHQQVVAGEPHQCGSELVVDHEDDGMHVVGLDGQRLDHDNKGTHEETVIHDGQTTYTYITNDDQEQLMEDEAGQQYVIRPRDSGQMSDQPRGRGRPRRTVNFDDGPPYSCSMCNMTFQAPPSLTRHVQAVHSGQPQTVYKCPQCTRSYSSRGNLNFHMRSGHNIQKRFRCKQPLCGKAFASRGQLDEHRKRGMCDVPRSVGRHQKTRVGSSRQMPTPLQLPHHQMNIVLNQMPEAVSLLDDEEVQGTQAQPHVVAPVPSSRTTMPLKLLYCQKNSGSQAIDGRNMPRQPMNSTHWKPYPCQRCGQTFSSDEVRNAHQAKHK